MKTLSMSRNKNACSSPTCYSCEEITGESCQFILRSKAGRMITTTSLSRRRLAWLLLVLIMTIGASMTPVNSSFAKQSRSRAKWVVFDGETAPGVVTLVKHDLGRIQEFFQKAPNTETLDLLHFPNSGKFTTQLPPYSSVPKKNGWTALAWNKTRLPGGGFFNGGDGAALPRVDGSLSAIAFVRHGDADQGLYSFSGNSVQKIVVSCNDFGVPNKKHSCGDPTPIGGTFAGFAALDLHKETSNERGDVAFVADIKGGTNSRALFLYQASEGKIIKIVSPKDPAPQGGRFNFLGSANLNNHGDLTFYSTTSDGVLRLFHWKSGKLRTIASDGDFFEGSTIYLQTLGAAYSDGTTLWGEPPSINDSGQIAFLVTEKESPNDEYGKSHILLWDGVKLRSYLKAGTPGPRGLKWQYFNFPIMNRWGEIAFSGALDDGSGGGTAGWYAGKPNHIRTVWDIDTVIEGQKLVPEIPMSHPQLPALNDQGDVIAWIGFHSPAGLAKVDAAYMVSKRDGTTTVIARNKKKGEVLGQPFSFLHYWPVAGKTYYCAHTLVRPYSVLAVYPASKVSAGMNR